jgi:nicotinate-nucleotide pyrophosphorylase (carboxylating)
MNNNVLELIRLALDEDQAFNDVTTLSIVPADRDIDAQLIARSRGVICGLEIFKRVFTLLDRRCRMEEKVKDGGQVRPGQVIAELHGPARAILSGERTALNFIQHLSGIATLTHEFTLLVKDTSADIYDTRKTLPGLRELAKYAVRCGGGVNHRMNLSDMALIKDNHLHMVEDLKRIVNTIKSRKRGMKVEVECENLAQVELALEAAADMIMLDNMDVKTLRAALRNIDRHAQRTGTVRPEIEVSGGVNLKTVRKFAQLGVNRISVGALTHSAPALDLSLEMETALS